MTLEVVSPFHMYLSSSESILLSYPGDRIKVFKFNFPQFLRFTGDWQLSLEELHLKLTRGFSYGDWIDIESDAVEVYPGILHMTNLLRRIQIQKAQIRNETIMLSSSRYTHLKKGEITSIIFKIKPHSERGRIDDSVPVNMVVSLRQM